MNMNLKNVFIVQHCSRTFYTADISPNHPETDSPPLR